MHHKYKNWSAIVLLVVIGVAIYANSFGNAFVWDDKSLIVENNYIKDWRCVSKIFTSDLYHSKTAHSNFYRPVLSLSFLVDYSIWKLHPFGYHITNTLLHIINALLIYFLVGRISNNMKMASITSLFFMVHPIHTEAITYISGRAEPLATFFLLLSLFLFIRSTRCLKVKRILLSGGSAVAFGLALLSKEIALILPFIVMLYNHCFVLKEGDGEFREKSSPIYLSYLIVIALYVYWRILFLNLTYKSSMPYDLYSRLLTICKVIISYIGLLFFPFNLHMERFIPISHSLFELPVLFSITLLAIAVVFTIEAYKRSKIVFFSFLWFFIALVPVSNILLPINAMMAEHWLYIPSIGFFVIMAMGCMKAAQSKLLLFSTGLLKKGVALLFVVILIFYSALTVKRNTDWKDELTFFKENLEDSSHSALAYYHLGYVYHGKKMYDQAIHYYEEALKIDPRYAEVYSDLGVIYYHKGMTEETIAALEKAVEVNPHYAVAHNNLGMIYNESGRYKEAALHLERAVGLEPTYTKAYYHLGVAYQKIGEKEKALHAWEKALELEPTNEEMKEAIEKIKENILQKPMSIH